MDISSSIYDPVRLAAVERAGLGKEVAQPTFDRLARLITRLLDVPAGTVTVVRPDEQIFVGADGLSGKAAEDRGTPISHSYCRFVVESGIPLIIGDARLHELTKNNPAITEYNAIAYAGIPIITAGGEVVGTVCAIDSMPRVWSDADLATLMDLTAIATAEIELRLLRESIEVESARVARSGEAHYAPSSIGAPAQTQKMETLGQLAAGIAHDFNNMLTVITACSGLALSAAPPGSDLFGDVSEIDNAARRAAQLTRQILAYARNQPARKQALELNPIIEELRQMLSRVLSSGITVQCDLAEGLWKAHADVTQIQQLIMNLAINARDAMVKGGVLVFSTANTTLTQMKSGRLGSVPAGKYVRIGVTDTGEGIADNVLHRVFEPFFTTKAAGVGTGLGLATVQAIIADLGGQITIDTEVGKGTSIGIYLPRIDDSVA